MFLEQKKDIKWRDMLSEYRWDFIFSYVKEHEECSRTAVLFSGDIGFYSGAKNWKRPFCIQRSIVRLN